MRVAVTQSEPDRLVAALGAEGLEAVACPLVRTEPLPGPPVRADAYDWLVVTSRNGVEALFGRIEGPLPRVAAIGPGTAAALRARGVQPDVVAAESTQEGLVEALRRRGGRVLFAGAAGARDVLARDLGADVVALYRTVELRPERFPDADLVTLASPSAARAFAGLGRALPCVSIGPVTTAAARERGLDVVVEAESHDRDGLVRAVKLAASRLASSRS